MGKVTVKHFLSNKVKPVEGLLYGDNQYPLYVRITLNGRSTEIKSRLYNFMFHINGARVVNGTLYLSETLLKKSEDESDTFFKQNRNQALNFFKLEERGIHAIHEYYSGILGDNFTIKVFNEVADSALSSVQKIVNEYCIDCFRDILATSDNYQEIASVISSKVDFSDLVDAVETITYNFSDSTKTEFGIFFEERTGLLSDLRMAYLSFIEYEQIWAIEWIKGKYSDAFESYIESCTSGEKVLFGDREALISHCRSLNQKILKETESIVERVNTFF